MHKFDYCVIILMYHNRYTKLFSFSLLFADRSTGGLLNFMGIFLCESSEKKEKKYGYTKKSCGNA